MVAWMREEPEKVTERGTAEANSERNNNRKKIARKLSSDGKANVDWRSMIDRMASRWTRSRETVEERTPPHVWLQRSIFERIWVSYKRRAEAIKRLAQGRQSNLWAGQQANVDTQGDQQREKIMKDLSKTENSSRNSIQIKREMVQRNRKKSLGNFEIDMVWIVLSRDSSELESN